jgi:methylphosphotriester-DNA--protein-cysteine methyltransferase
LATKAKIRATAKALCFRACTDCKSADECDPDENWIKEALAILERPGLRGLVDGHKAAFDTR